MIKNSTILIAACLIMAGIIANGIISNIFERANLQEQHLAEQEIKRLEINEKLLETEPKVLQMDDTDLLLIPEVNFRNNNINIDYTFYRHENQNLVKIQLIK